MKSPYTKANRRQEPALITRWRWRSHNHHLTTIAPTQKDVKKCHFRVSRDRLGAHRSTPIAHCSCSDLHSKIVYPTRRHSRAAATRKINSKMKVIILAGKMAECREHRSRLKRDVAGAREVRGLASQFTEVICVLLLCMCMCKFYYGAS